MVNDIYKYRNRVDYLHDFPGADVEQDRVETVATPAETYPIQEDTPLDVSGATVTVTDEGDLKIYDSSGNVIEEPLDVSGATVTVTDDGSLDINTIPNVTIGTWSAGTLATEQQTPVGVEDSAGTQVDPATQALENALKANDTDELVARITGADGVEVQESALDTDAAAGDTALLTYLARALATIGQDELLARLTDSTGSQIDPDVAPEYPSAAQQQDLIGTGDLTIGPVDVSRSEAVIIVGNSTDGNTFSVSVEWRDSAGNVTKTEAPTYIALDSVTNDFARLIRKGEQVSVTYTDTSGGSSNNINAYVDAHR